MDATRFLKRFRGRLAKYPAIANREATKVGETAIQSNRRNKGALGRVQQFHLCGCQAAPHDLILEAPYVGLNEGDEVEGDPLDQE